MIILLGIFMVLGSILTGYYLAGGHMGVLWQPNELLMICGAAMGAFMISTPGNVIADTGRALARLFKTNSAKKEKFIEILIMTFKVFSALRKGEMKDFEEILLYPENADFFKQFPSIYKDKNLMVFFSEMVYSNFLIKKSNPSEVKNYVGANLKSRSREALRPAEALSNLADGLPGFGIVAATLGIVVTMGEIDQGAAVVGHHIAAALIGTFLGIFLAYGLVGPLAKKVQFQVEEEHDFYVCIEECLLDAAQQHAPMVLVERGRNAIPPVYRPGYSEMEMAIKEF